MKINRPNQLNELGTILLIVGLLIAGAAGTFVTSKYDQLTGTTIEERCEMRQRNLAMIAVIEADPDREPSEEQIALKKAYTAFVERFCGPDAAGD